MFEKLSKGSLIGLVVCLLLFLAVGMAPPSYGAGGEEMGYTPDRILVKFSPGVDRVAQREVHQRQGGIVVQEIRQLGVKVVKVGSSKFWQRLAGYRGERLVAYAEPDYIAHAVESPNDPYFPQQWGMGKIKAPAAWDITHGSDNIKIAILDTGIDQDHVELARKLVANENFSDSSTVDDIYGHGTHVAGIAAAMTNNTVGVAGIGYDCSLMNVKVLGDAGWGHYSWIASGITWAADNGAKVINMSLGGSSSSDTLSSAIDYAWSKGVVLAAAAGNQANSEPFYPAYYERCIAVAAIDSGDGQASFSNYGGWVDVAAPGVDIYSTVPGGYASWGGTSMASPHVAGLAGLVWATEYGSSNAEVRQRIESTADPVGSFVYYGRINAYEAVRPAGPAIAFSPPSFSFSAVAGGANPADQVLTISNASGGSLGWQLSDDAAWLSLEPTSGSSTDVTVSVNITGLPAGSYDATITIAAGGASNTPRTVPVTLTISSPSPTMHVASIDMGLIKSWLGRTYATAEVRIVDAQGAPVCLGLPYLATGGGQLQTVIRESPMPRAG